MSHSKQSNLDENQEITLEAYEKDYLKYIEGTRNDISDTLKEYLDYSLSKIPKGTEILEIGSATGRDADYIEKKGYVIQRSDAVVSFVEYMKQNGHDAQMFNVLTDSLNKEFGAVIATAVLLHLNSEQFEKALSNIRQHLASDGVLVIAMKVGTGEEYSTHKMNTARYFKYWQPEELSNAVSFQGFNVQESKILSGTKWLTCIATKA